jgi:hypothetical protein
MTNSLTRRIGVLYKPIVGANQEISRLFLEAYGKFNTWISGLRYLSGIPKTTQHFGNCRFHPRVKRWGGRLLSGVLTYCVD